MKLRNKIIAMVLAVAVGVSLIPHATVTAEFENGFWYETHWSIDKQRTVATITYYNGPGGNVIIPSMLGGYPVEIIGGQVFSRNNSTALTSVVIPNGVTSIGIGAFLNQSSLTSITIPNSVKTIEDSAFWGCINLTSITLPNSVTKIGEYAFYDCTKLAVIFFPDSVTSVGRMAFRNTAWLNSQPNGMVYVGRVALTYKGNMPTNSTITLNANTTVIADWAFENLNDPNITRVQANLASIIIPNSITNIGNFAFIDCINLTSITFRGATPPTFGDYIFTVSQFISTVVSAIVYVPCGSMAVYRTISQLNIDRFKIQEPHIPSANWTSGNPATCTTASTRIKTCTVVGCSATVETENQGALGHNYPTAWAVTTSATCFADGTERRTCTRACGLTGHTQTQPITTRPPHTTPANWTSGTTATCTTASTRIKTCSVVGCSATVETENQGAYGGLLHIKAVKIGGYDLIEIYNIADKAISTKGLYISDNDNLLKWQMPSMIIRAGQAISIADYKRGQVNFNVQSAEILRLTSADGTPITCFSINGNCVCG